MDVEELLTTRLRQAAAAVDVPPFNPANIPLAAATPARAARRRHNVTRRAAAIGLLVALPCSAAAAAGVAKLTDDGSGLNPDLKSPSAVAPHPQKLVQTLDIDGQTYLLSVILSSTSDRSCFQVEQRRGEARIASFGACGSGPDPSIDTVFAGEVVHIPTTGASRVDLSWAGGSATVPITLGYGMAAGIPTDRPVEMAVKNAAGKTLTTEKYAQP